MSDSSDGLDAVEVRAAISPQEARRTTARTTHVTSLTRTAARRAELLEALAQLDVGEGPSGERLDAYEQDGQRYEVVGFEPLIKKAVVGAMDALETLQTEGHLNEHAYNSIAVGLKRIYDADAERRVAIETQFCIELVAYDPFVLDSVPASIMWEDYRFLANVLRYRFFSTTVSGPNGERIGGEDADRTWISHVCSFYLRCDVDLLRTRDYLLVFALEATHLMDVVLNRALRECLLCDAFASDGFAMEIVKAYPWSVCWLCSEQGKGVLLVPDSRCPRPLSTPCSPACKSRWLLVMAAEHASVEEWKDAGFRSVVDEATKGMTFVNRVEAVLQSE